MRVGWRGDSSRRAAALQRYRPYLQAPEPELQRAAVYAARTLNDYAVRDEIEHISWTSADWKARSMARILFKAFLTVGPDPDVWPKVNGVPIGMYDPEGLRAYRASRPEWEAEFHRLRTGEDAPPGWPNVQPMERDPAQSQPSGGGSRRSLGSP